MAKPITTDIFIAGGGIAGLVAAAAFGAEGYRVIIADPAPPVTEAGASGADLRTTAFLQPSLGLLRAAGLWDRLAPFATPLQTMRIIDAGGDLPQARAVKDFNADEISDQPFGWNLPNWLLRREMLARLSDLPWVSFLPGLAAERMLTRQTEARVHLSDGQVISARLIIGADGRDSRIRQGAGIGHRRISYGQKAVVFAVGHPVPHHNVSTEIHRTGGPFTLVPLPDTDEGAAQSAVVWMERGPEAQRLFALPQAEFEAEASRRSCEVLGPLRLTSRRSLWPIISQLADRMSAQRVALIAEAAHVVPPIGAQGLNMSLADLTCLLSLVKSSADPGEAGVLQAYHRARHPEVSARFFGIDALNRASMVEAKVLRDLRAGALGLLHGLQPVRQGLMRAGLGLRGAE